MLLIKLTGQPVYMYAYLSNYNYHINIMVSICKHCMELQCHVLQNSVDIYIDHTIIKRLQLILNQHDDYIVELFKDYLKDLILKN